MVESHIIQSKANSTAQMSEKSTASTLEPILFLLQSADIEVQRAASAALGNLAVNSEYTNPQGSAARRPNTSQPRTRC